MPKRGRKKRARITAKSTEAPRDAVTAQVEVPVPTQVSDQQVHMRPVVKPVVNHVVKLVVNPVVNAVVTLLQKQAVANPLEAARRHGYNVDKLEQVTGITSFWLNVAERFINDVCDNVLQVLQDYKSKRIPVDLSDFASIQDAGDQRVFRQWEDYTTDEFTLIVGRLTGLVLNNLMDNFMKECRGDISKHECLTELGFNMNICNFLRGWADFAVSMTVVNGQEISRTPGPLPMPACWPRRHCRATPSPESALTSTKTGLEERAGVNRTANSGSESSGPLVAKNKCQVASSTQRHPTLQQGQKEITGLVIQTVLQSIADLGRHGNLPNTIHWTGHLQVSASDKNKT